MKQIRKILAPVDFSEPSQRALDEAIGFARSFGAELHLLHCHELHPGVSPYGIAVPETLDHDVRMGGAPAPVRVARQSERTGHPRAGAFTVKHRSPS